MGTIILGVETSCDDTCAAVVLEGRQVLSNVVSTDPELHEKYGGIIPEVASRRHLELISPVIIQALDQAQVGFNDLSAIAVTQGPGLVGALLVGLCTAKAAAFAAGKPLLGVHHVVGHVYANWLERPCLNFPLLCLVASGGHTSLLLMAGHGQVEEIGRTRDDAAGEVFDKVARAMGLGYPGGPAIEALAREGNPEAVKLPRAWLEEGSFDFSFSGLKTAVLRVIRERPGLALQDLAASFQQAVIDVLVEKTIGAALKYGVPRVLLAGGVAANSSLRRGFIDKTTRLGLELYYPRREFCTDNAAMIASAGYFQYLAGEYAPWDLNAYARLDYNLR